MATVLDPQPKISQVPKSETADAARADMEGTTSNSVGLKRVPPYWHPYSTMAKGRWFNREILELVSTEFRDRSIDYYVCRRRRACRYRKLGFLLT